MTCKDCLYKPMCKYNQSYTCDNFKNKSNFIELPCNIGDTVFHNCEVLGGLLPYFVESLTIMYDSDKENYYTYEANARDSYEDELLDCIDFDLDDIGKTVFFTKEEAEQALKDRDN